jgi:glyoxylase-like metal-dependent hydrolase (beta-lactamase superfamily II)
VTAVEVADGIVAFLQEPGTLGLSNATLIRDGGTSLVVDAMLLPEMSEQVAAAAVALGTSVDTVLLSHHHIDHCGGSAVFGAARVVAHPPTAADVRKVLSEPDLLDRLMPRYAGRFAALGARVPEPVDLAALDIPRGGQPVVFGPAHSFHDVALWLPGERVLVAADLCSNGVLPLAIHGSIAHWADALSQLIALEPETVVPGHGPVGSVQTLRDLREYLVRINALAETAVRTGSGVDEALAELDPGAAGGWLEQGRTRQNMTKAIEQARSRAGYIPGHGPVIRESVS